MDSLWGRGANGAEILGLSQSHLQSMLILNMLTLYIIMNMLKINMLMLNILILNMLIYDMMSVAIKFSFLT